MQITQERFTSWVVVQDALGYASIHEQPEDGASGTGDLIAHVFGEDNVAELIAASQELESALIQLLAIAGTPITDRQVEVFKTARAALAKANGGAA